ncbi:hypothetical protein [Estrella lausannensis]|uniref:Uncharacterized protein n=1 Tax=Estrella lausannensis TaxID=483423 RepID=A0A0H5E801_9BACT|nr:hypothetical protein [Estrella lausannensis]CRX39475.1 hypothetical protein ELAC_2154 [Estrella lausannensis]
MSISLNTWGIRSINRETFNIKPNDSLYMPIQVRNVAITAMRIWNIVMNILGYIPGVQIVSGALRIVAGIAIAGFTAAIGEREATCGPIIGRWYDEAINTGMAQIVRGALEALIPFGFIANASLDIIATPLNIYKEICPPPRSVPADRETLFVQAAPYPDIIYPVPLGILHLA